MTRLNTTRDGVEYTGGAAHAREPAIQGGHVSHIPNYAPGGQGDNIFQLLRVNRGGVPTLVGSYSKGGPGLIDMLTGEVLYDFSEFGAPPRLGFDSYSCACEWYNAVAGRTEYAFGGWVKTPAVVGSSNDHTNKYAYVVSTADFRTWTKVVEDVSQVDDGWMAEVTDLVAGNNRLFILRGDKQAGSYGGSTNEGIYSYDGASVTKLTGDVMAVKGIVYRDFLLAFTRGSTTVQKIDITVNDAVSTYSWGTSAVNAGGSAKAPDGTYQGGFGILNNQLYLGNLNGYFVGDPNVDANDVFVPAFITPNNTAGLRRIVAWRSPFIQCAGGLVVAANLDYPSGNTDAVQSALIWIGPGGQIKTLAFGGSFGGMEIFGDRLYFGLASSYHSDIYTNYRTSRPQLCSIPIEQIISGKPPAFTEGLSYTSYNASTSGVNGMVGGYPTTGYTRGKLVLDSSATADLTLYGWPAQKSGTNADHKPYALATATAFTAGDSKVIDISDYLGGWILGFKFSTTTTFQGFIEMS